MMSPITSIPGKYIWATGAVLFNLAKFPILSVYYLPKYTRPHPEWTVFQSVMNNLMNSFLYHTACVESVTPLDLTPGSLGDRFVAIQPGPDEIYVKNLSSDPEIKPLPTGGIWFPKALDKNPTSRLGKPILLHFHPGGYVMGDVRMDGSFAAGLMTERIGSHSFWSLYRLASNPHGKFPAALQDGLAAYHYLLKDLSIPASQIVLSGDSAGGHIVICMLRYLAEHGDKIGLPAPKGALLFSPATNLAAATNPKNLIENHNYQTDYLDPLFISWGAGRFVNNDPAVAPYMNPLEKPFKSPCPIWVYCGGCEVFYDDVTEFVTKMESVTDNNITYRVEKLANHDIFFAGNLMGWKAEAEKIADEAGAWVVRL